MYNVGDKVLHQCEGACYITEIVEQQVDLSTKQYYQLESVIDRNSRVYVSTEKHGRIRSVIDKNTLRQSEIDMQSSQYHWPENSMERYKEFHKNLDKFDFSSAMNVFRSLTLESKKNKLLMKDEQLRKTSEKMVCSEIAIILNKSYDFVKEEVTTYIINTGIQPV